MRVFLYPLAMTGTLLACNTDPGSRDYPNPTLLEVVSRYFEGAPDCAQPDAGTDGYARYVATLVELEAHADGEITATPVAIAPPTRCGRELLFAGTNAQPLRTEEAYRYYARIELFTQDDVELRDGPTQPDGELAQVVRDGQPVSPTHVGVCGSLDLPLLDLWASAVPFAPADVRTPALALVGTDGSDAGPLPPGDAGLDAALGEPEASGDAALGEPEASGDAATEALGDAATDGGEGSAVSPPDAGANGPWGGPDAGNAAADAGASKLDTRPEQAWQWSVRARERRTVVFSQCTFEHAR